MNNHYAKAHIFPCYNMSESGCITSDNTSKESDSECRKVFSHFSIIYFAYAFLIARIKTTFGCVLNVMKYSVLPSGKIILPSGKIIHGFRIIDNQILLQISSAKTSEAERAHSLGKIFYKRKFRNFIIILF